MEVNMGDLTHGLMVTVIGMGITFIVLLVLSYVLDLFRILSKGPSSKKADAEEKAEKIKPEPVENISIAEETNSKNDLELVAVITAAIAASLNTTSDQLVVRSFRRIGNRSSQWNNLFY
jgi:sodium pump decarboxylase gamma subunit